MRCGISGGSGVRRRGLLRLSLTSFPSLRRRTTAHRPHQAPSSNHPPSRMVEQYFWTHHACQGSSSSQIPQPYSTPAIRQRVGQGDTSRAAPPRQAYTSPTLQEQHAEPSRRCPCGTTSAIAWVWLLGQVRAAGEWQLGHHHGADIWPIAVGLR